MRLFGRCCALSFCGWLLAAAAWAATEPVKPAAPAAAAPPANPDLLVYRDGDRLRGRLLEIADAALSWDRNDLKAPIKTQLERLRALTLGGETKSLAQGSFVQLTNGDGLAGTIVGLSEQTLTLDTPYAGRLEIPRAMLARLSALKGEGTRRVDLLRLSAWTKHSGTWDDKNGKLTGQSGAVSRNLFNMDVASIRCLVTWTGSRPDFSLILFSLADNYGAEGYNLYFNGAQVLLQQGINNNMGAAQFRAPATRKMRVEVLVQKGQGRVVLKVDGRQVADWTTGYQAQGAALTLCANSEGQTSFEDLEVFRGAPRAEEAPAAEVSEDKTDRLVFARSSQLAGRTLGIAEGKLQFKSDYGVLAVPLSELSLLTFAGADAQRARRNKGDVQLFFASGERLTLKLDGIRGGQVSGASENFGAHQFDLTYFRGMRFNIYEKEAEGEEAPAGLPF